MEEASRVVLAGHTLKIGVDDPVIYPDHYHDKRGAEMWSQVLQLLNEVETTHRREVG
jgi:hypothetical protein